MHPWGLYYNRFPLSRKSDLGDPSPAAKRSISCNPKDVKRDQ